MNDAPQRSLVGRAAIALMAIGFATALDGACGNIVAQSIDGVLIEKQSGRPIEGAMIVLLTTDGSRLRSVLTDAAGRFAISVPAAGEYVLRADRIGHASITTPPINVSGTAAVSYRIEADIAPISLATIDVAAPSRECTVRRTADAAETARVWEEARKALELTSLVQENRTLRFVGRTFDRTRDPETGRITEENVRPFRRFTSRPFYSNSADDLAEHGYVRSLGDGRQYEFLGPSADVLLSASFLATHCLDVVRGQNETDGLIGLAFRPVRGLKNPDIEGTFWLDAATAELRLLEYSYTGVGEHIPVTDAGGRIEFDVLTNGMWFISDWVIRMPATTVQRTQWSGSTLVRPRVVSIREEGGTIVNVFDMKGQPIERVRTRPGA